MICGKVIYQSRDEANKILAKAWNNRNKGQSGGSYFCEDCKGWHVYTMEKKAHMNKHSKTTDITTKESNFGDTLKSGHVIIHDARKFKIK